MDQPTFIGSILPAIPLYLYWLAWALTNIGCAYFVYQAAIRRKRKALNVGPGWWAIFTLFGGLWSLALYWLMEHSSMSRSENDDAP
jgi:hypothetical protein